MIRSTFGTKANFGCLCHRDTCKMSQQMAHENFPKFFNPLDFHLITMYTFLHEPFMFEFLYHYFTHLFYTTLHKPSLKFSNTFSLLSIVPLNFLMIDQKSSFFFRIFIFFFIETHKQNQYSSFNMLSMFWTKQFPFIEERFL